MSAGVCLLFFISSTEITKRLRNQQLMVNPVKTVYKVSNGVKTKSVVVVIVVVVYFSFRFSVTD